MSTAAAPTLTLLHGAEIPVLGLGTWPLKGDEAAAAVRTAIESGYRLIDTAENYRNEEAVGQGIRDCGIDRAELFITTKFNREWHSIEGVRQAWQAAIGKLGVEYLDLFMVHWPNPHQGDFVAAVRGLAKLLADGSVRAIGVSNFKPTHLNEVLEQSGLIPDVNQIQLSPYVTRPDARRFHDEHRIVTESWSPIGGAGEDLRNDPVVTAIAAAHQKTPTQVVLRWHHQLGLVAIPKSGDPDRIAENIAIFDFALSKEDMTAISALDRGDEWITDSDEFGH